MLDLRLRNRLPWDITSAESGSFFNSHLKTYRITFTTMLYYILWNVHFLLLFLHNGSLCVTFHQEHGDTEIQGTVFNGTGDMEHTRACERSGENFRSPLTWVFAPPAPPLKVTPDRSAHFRSPLTYNFIPLR